MQTLHANWKGSILHRYCVFWHVSIWRFTLSIPLLLLSQLDMLFVVCCCLLFVVVVGKNKRMWQGGRRGGTQGHRQDLAQAMLQVQPMPQAHCSGLCLRHQKREARVQGLRHERLIDRASTSSSKALLQDGPSINQSIHQSIHSSTSAQKEICIS